MDQITTQTPADSNILAYGTSSALPRGPLLAVMIICFFTAIVGLFWLLFSRPINIPNATIIAIASPKTLMKRLPSEATQTLPAPWRDTLASASRWPALFGSYQDDRGWHSFAVLPVWIKTPSAMVHETHGLIKIVSEEALSRTHPIRYTEQLSWWLSHPLSPVVGRLDLDQLFRLPDTNAATSTQTLWFTYRSGVINTDLTFEHPAKPLALYTVDLALSLSTLQQETSWRPWLTSLLVPPLPTTTPSIDQAYIQWNGDWTKNTLSLFFSQDLNDRQAKDLLANFGIYSRSIQKLPDGGLFTEQKSFEPQEGASLYQNYNLPNRQGQLDLAQSRVIISTLDDLQSFKPIPVSQGCVKDTIVARFSGRIMDKLFEHLGLGMTLSIPAVQIAESSEHKMKLCLEQ